ncbi:hypothetical protein HMSSN036_50160 [Paenibacillus macerans]|nr:hypothetical protein HMSSN036_50160 [Paenibacillus macerans]
MNNLLITPVVIPLLTGMVLIIFQKNIQLQKVLSLAALLATGVVSVLLINQIRNDGIQTLQLGGWEAPYGISFVGDMFSALLLLATSVVSAGCLLYAFPSIGRRQEKLYFYPLVLFLVTGVNGSFLTGDLFNLYVFLKCFCLLLMS